MNRTEDSVKSASEREILSQKVHDRPQAHQREIIASPMKSKGMLSSGSRTTNMSLVEGLNHPFLLSKKEKNLNDNSLLDSETGPLSNSEKEQIAKLFPNPTSSLTLSSALAISSATSEREIASAMVTPGNRNKDDDDDGMEDNVMEDNVDLSSFLPMIPITPTSNDISLSMKLQHKKSSNFLNSPTGVADTFFQEEGNADPCIPSDNFLLENTVCGHIQNPLCNQQQHQPNIPPLSPGNKNLSIENQHIFINGLIAKSLTETITLMGSMRHQSQKIQQQLEELGVLPGQPFLNLKSNAEDVCNSTSNMFSSWQPPVIPIPDTLRQHKRRRASGKETFPMKLHRLLSDLEHVDDGSSIATFLPDGMAFVIKDTAKFEKTVLKMYFPRMKNFSSFHRQLNLYDFERLGSFAPVGQAKGAYSHTLFRRNQPSWAALMRPTRIKGGTSSAAMGAAASQKRLSCTGATSEKESSSCTTTANN